MSKIALVTGATRGIGKEIARQLAAMDIRVLVGGRSRQAAELVAQEIGQFAEPAELDVNKKESVQACAESILLRHGRLDILINNAGIGGDRNKARIGTDPVKEGIRVFDTNVWGAVRVTEAMLPLLRIAPAARIVFVSSSVGSMTRMTDPDHYFAHKLPALLSYPVSKAALNMVTVQYAKELRQTGILVNAADPGACDTEFNDGYATDIQRTAADGARIATRLATLGADGPSGTLSNDLGVVPW